MMWRLFLGIFLAFIPFKATYAETPEMIVLGCGVFNAARGYDRAIQFQAEYRTGYRFCQKLLPIAGLFITTKTSTYIYGGFGIDFKFFNQKIAIFPSISAGLYAKGHGKNLRYPVEFRSSVEGAYVFDNQSQLGIQISHLSNAGLSKPNPGEESLVILYSFPLNLLSF